jgi:hypothetical protein
MIMFLFVERIGRVFHGKRRTTLLLGFAVLGAHLQPLVCACVFPHRSDVQFYCRHLCILVFTDVFHFVAALKRPKLNQEGLNRVFRALQHRDHHYTNFI